MDCTNPVTLQLLKVSGVGPIRQLIVSPEKDYLAVVRSHTVHIVVLPDRKHLYSSDTSPLKNKCYHLGPTCHVLDQSPVVSVLWHPLGEQGRCLVTITADGVVRLWEIHHNNQSSFNEPSTSADLKKLANATSAAHDFSASKYGSGKAFTPDSVELQPAAACFGGRAEEGEYPWRSMTLWIAMKEGEVYALCPLLPKRWQTYPGLRETLSLTVSANDIEADESDAKVAAQTLFLEDLQAQQPFLVPGASEFDTAHVYSRPESLSAAPKLQGPFEMEPEIDEGNDVTDLLVFAVGSSEVEEDEAQSPASVISLLTNSGTLHTYLDLEGVEAQWLPPRSATTPFSTPRKPASTQVDEYRTLLSFETINFSPPRSNTVPSFTRDVCAPDAFFVTTAAGVHYVSMASWLHTIDREIGDPAEGANVRLDAPLQEAQSLIEHPINLAKLSNSSPGDVASSVIFTDSSRDSTLGYLLLTASNGQPYAAQLDIADKELNLISESQPERDGSPARALVLHEEAREAYRPDPRFQIPSSLPKLLQGMPRQELQQEVRLSKATLQLLTDTHRILSNETHVIGAAASDLFLQCKRLQAEFQDQIQRAREVKERIEGLTGDDEDVDEEGEAARGTARIMRRLESAVDRQQSIVTRHEELKKRLAKVSARDLSDKEKAWIAEVKKLQKTLPPADDPACSEVPLVRRMEDVKELTRELVAQAKSVEGDAALKGKESTRDRSAVKVPEGFRKAKVKGVMELLDRESALVEAAAERLGRLSVQT